MQKEKIIDVVANIMGMLATLQYALLVLNDSKKRLSSNTMAEILSDYGGRVTNPPRQAYQNIGIYIVKENIEATIDFDLWIDGQKVI